MIKLILPEKYKSLEAFSIGISSRTLSDVLYVNGKTVKVPIEYLHFQGHDLEGKLIELYPQLNGIKKKTEELLKLEIIDKIMDDLPGFIPADFVEAFHFVQQP
jgi:hypothetical protein